MGRQVELKRRRGPGRPQLYDWARGRDLWCRGERVEAIARALGCCTAQVCMRRRLDGWPERAPVPRAATVRVAPRRWRCQVPDCAALAEGPTCVRGHTRTGETAEPEVAA